MKLKIKGNTIGLIALIILILLSLYKIPNFISYNRLHDLGFSDEAIKAINTKGVKAQIIRNNFYSKYLEQEVMKDTFKKEYLELYTVNDNLNEDSFYLYEKLKALKAYSDEELVKLYGNLKYYELTPLVVFDKVDVDAYIEDCKNHPDNSPTKMTLSNSYLNAYENVIEVSDPENIETYVSKKSYIGEYVPTKLVDIPSINAVPNLKLESRGLDAFTQLCNALRDNDSAVYAVSAYRSYEEQKEMHDNYGGGKEADNRVFRPGYYDDQLGLSVAIVAAENESAANFDATSAYKFMTEHGHEYGFIQRYPEGKESITGEDARKNYYRFVGQELASQIHQSGLTFDEYYMLYMYNAETTTKQ